MAPCPLVSPRQAAAREPSPERSFWAALSALGRFQHAVDAHFPLDFTPVFLGSTSISDLKLELFVPHQELRNCCCRSRFEITKISQNPFFSPPSFAPFLPQFFSLPQPRAGFWGVPALIGDLVLPPLIPLCSSPGKAPLICQILGFFNHEKLIFLFSSLSSFPSSLKLFPHP